MGQALYRKYRTKTFADTIGQEHITKTLENAIKQGKISHAYLLTGPRGTGKTSIARILAHEINNLPYDDTTHLDIIEIDAASNRRIDEIRDLRDRVNTAPVSAKYKVYIIDEVHMLTKEAFNALLKTLEEPPAHVVFVLATTEAHKLPDTIVSRTQRYSLRPVPKVQVIAHLKSIAKSENIIIDEAALELIAEHGEGSFRDSISLLDQASSLGSSVARADIERMLGLAPAVYIDQIVDALSTHDAAAVVQALNTSYGQGYEPAMIAAQLGASLRTRLLQGANGGDDSITLLKQLLDVPAARDSKQLLEITLLGAALAGGTAPQAVTAPEPTPQPKPTPVVAKTMPRLAPEPTPEPITPAIKPAEDVKLEEPIEEKPIISPEPAQNIEEVTELWQQTLDAIKKQYNTLYGIARMATPELSGNTLTLSLKFAFHQKRLTEAKNRKIINDVVERLSGRHIEILCIVADAASIVPAHTKPDVSAISNIFGGAELLES